MMNVVLIICLALFSLSCTSLAVKESESVGKSSQLLTLNQETRGGEGMGAPVVYDKSPSRHFLQIAKANSKKEKDRLAILSQIGDYQVHFEFVETMSFTDRKPDKPYYSWATEYIFPLVDEPDRIVLQHILVMRNLDQDGKIMDPHVVKHWRQDWTYQDPVRLDYRGHNQWKKTQLNKRDVKGLWAQAVYQVDDSPRYKSLGVWEHDQGFSRWTGEKIGRPLPRREATVRSDYHLMRGRNIVTVTPSGWVHEQDNDKVEVDSQALNPKSIVAREVGLNRYIKIKDFDFNPGKQYWNQTKAYWGLVRKEWDRIISSNQSFALKSKVDDNKLYQAHFAFAQKIIDDKIGDPMKIETHAKSTIENYLIK
jgi:hypothetical protein